MMRSFSKILSLAVTCCWLVSAEAVAGSAIEDATGSYRVNSKDQVVAQTIVSDKLPDDTLIVTFNDSREPLVKVVNHNLMVVTESRIFGRTYVAARIPREIYWFRTRFHHNIEWTKRGRDEKVFRLPIEAIAHITYVSHEGKRHEIFPTTPELCRPMYWPSRMPQEAELRAKKKKRKDE